MAQPRTQMSAPIHVPVAPDERRKSARAPLVHPIRIGPANGLPYASVSARDLSAGGLFVDAERNVRVGARFSVEVPLSTGERVYVAEAEVIDNRRQGAGRGFGARFVSLSDDAQRLLEAELANRAHVTLRSVKAEEPSGFDAPLPDLRSKGAPMGGATGFELGDEIEAVNRAMASVIPSTFSSSAPVDELGARSRWSEMKDWLRSLPAISGALYGVGAVALVAVGFAVLTEDRGQAETVALAAPRTVDDSVHDVLVGEERASDLREPTLSPAGERRVLPERERIEAPKPAVDPQPLEETVAAAPAPTRAPKAAGAPKPAARKAAAPQAPAPKVAEAAPAPRSSSTGHFGFPISGSAKIRKQFVLHNPERFVVDVAGLSAAPKLPEPVGRLRNARFGRHDGFGRFVFDMSQPLVSGSARVSGGELRVQLQFR